MMNTSRRWNELGRDNYVWRAQCGNICDVGFVSTLVERAGGGSGGSGGGDGGGDGGGGGGGGGGGSGGGAPENWLNVYKDLINLPSKLRLPAGTDATSDSNVKPAVRKKESGFRVVVGLTGPAKSGKTSVSVQWADDVFFDSYTPTIGVGAFGPLTPPHPQPNFQRPTEQ